MVIRKAVVQVSRIDDSCTVDQDVQLWLILVLSILIHGFDHVQFVFVLVKLDELCFDSFDEVL